MYILKKKKFYCNKTNFKEVLNKKSCKKLGIYSVKCNSSLERFEERFKSTVTKNVFEKMHLKDDSMIFYDLFKKARTSQPSKLNFKSLIIIKIWVFLNALSIRYLKKKKVNLSEVIERNSSLQQDAVL